MKTCPNNSYLSLVFEPHCRLLRVRLPKDSHCTSWVAILGAESSLYRKESHSVLSASLRSHGLSSPWNSPGQNTGVCSCSRLQGIFPTQGSNPGLPHFRLFLYQLSHQGSPRILQWVAYPFSRGSSWLRNQTRVSCIAGGFFTSWATREAHDKVKSKETWIMGGGGRQSEKGDERWKEL